MQKTLYNYDFYSVQEKMRVAFTLSFFLCDGHVTYLKGESPK